MNMPNPVSRELDHLLARAGAGEPQNLEDETACVLISLAEYERLTARREKPHLGEWLVENAPRVGDIDLPPRGKDRPVVFDDGTFEEVGE